MNRLQPSQARYLGMKPATIVWLVFVGGLVAREAVTFFVADHSVLFEYQMIAGNLVNGLGMSWNEWGRLPLQPTALFPPLYIYWCALFISIFGQNYLPMYMVQAVVAASGCIPAYLAGKRMFGERVGLLFSLGYSVYPEMLFIHSRAVPEFLYVLICLWLLYYYLRLLQSDCHSREFLRDAWVAGLLFGIGLLVREGVLIVGGAAGISLLLHKRPLKVVIRRAAIPVIIAVVMIVTPWTIRNWVAQGRFIPLRSAYGLNLWMGNHEEATGTDRTVDGGYQMGLLWEKNKDYYARTIPNDEYSRNRFYRDEAIQYIKTHPLQYAKLTVKRLWYYLWFDPIHPLAKNVIYRASYIILLMLGIPGIVRAFRQKCLDPILVISFAGFLVLYVPIIILPRYRIIPVVWLLLFAAYFVDRILQFRVKNDPFRIS